MSKYTPATAPCVTGCAKDHAIDADLGFSLCDAPLATGLPASGGRQLTVSASRVLEDGQPPVVAVAVAVDDREPLELEPAAARKLADALRSAADLAEQSLPPATGEVVA